MSDSKVRVVIFRNGSEVMSRVMTYSDALLFRLMFERAHLDDGASIEIEGGVL